MIIVITGPTCSNKSKIAIDVAKYFNAEIINADAFQVYKELNIGTAKPSKEEFSVVKHHLFDYVKPDINYSIYKYQQDGREIISSLLKEKKNIVIVGGSGLYIRSLLYDYTLLKNTKKTDLSRFDKLTNTELYNKLLEVDPESSLKIHPNNRRRVLRALEIYYSIGKKKSEIEASQSKDFIYNDVHLFSTEIDRELLYERINNRVVSMFDKGLLKEAKTLKKKYGKEAQSLQAIGYKEIIENPKMNKNQLIELISKNTRHYAKRQITFVRYQFKDKILYIKDSNEIIKELEENFYSRTKSLIGGVKLNKIKQAKIAVFGLGGVGGTALEALVRSGVTNLYLYDFDKVNPSNLNRQILFTKEDVGKPKVEVAKNRILKINPDVNVVSSNIFIKEENLNEIPFEEFDYVIDAIDSVPSKVALIKYLIKNKKIFISSLGMGNRLDLTKLDIMTLDKTHDDPLAKKLRNILKKDNIDLKKINVVSSNEIPLKNGRRISSMVFVPSTAGLLLANFIISLLIK